VWSDDLATVGVGSGNVRRPVPAVDRSSLFTRAPSETTGTLGPWLYKNRRAHASVRMSLCTLVYGVLVVGLKKPGNSGAGRPKKSAGGRRSKKAQVYRKRVVADGRSSDASAGIGYSSVGG
jgi:hypothetical protein